MPEPPVPRAAQQDAEPLSIIGPDGRVSRRTRERVTQRLAELGDDNLLGRHLLAMEAASDSPLIAGNRVGLLVDGPHTYAAMFEAIGAATETINVEMFIFDEAQHEGRKLSAVLIEKAAAGVAINVLYDAVGSSATPPAVLEALRAAGIRLCAFNPLSPVHNRTMQFTQRDHRKMMVVDARRAFVGGINFSASYTSGSRSQRLRRASPESAVKEGWRDTQIELHGPVTLELQRLFLESWAKQKCPPMATANYLPPPLDAGDTLLRVNATSNDSQRNETYVSALSAVTFAKTSVDLTMAYFAPDEQLAQALVDAAARGVRVRLLLAGLSDFGGIVYAGRAHYARLLEAGVQISEERSVMLHAKTLEVDGIWSTVGSANWDWLSFANNDELNVVVIDAGFATQMRQLFEADLAAATRITAKSWRDRSLKQRVLERFWVTWERWL